MVVYMLLGLEKRAGMLGKGAGPVANFDGRGWLGKVLARLSLEKGVGVEVGKGFWNF